MQIDLGNGQTIDGHLDSPEVATGFSHNESFRSMRTAHDLLLGEILLLSNYVICGLDKKEVTPSLGAFVRNRIVAHMTNVFNCFPEEQQNAVLELLNRTGIGDTTKYGFITGSSSPNDDYSGTVAFRLVDPIQKGNGLYFLLDADSNVFEYRLLQDNIAWSAYGIENPEDTGSLATLFELSGDITDIRYENSDLIVTRQFDGFESRFVYRREDDSNIYFLKAFA